MPKATINGIDMYYELHGPEGAPVLVLNNGLIMNATSSWVFQTPTLSRSYLLLQYDLRGQGHSEHPPGPYTMEMHADDLSALLAFLAVEKAHIAGISYGGEVAQAFVLKYPEMTRSLILADTVSEVSPALRIVVESWRDAAREGDPQLFFDVTVPWNFSPRFIGENPQVMEDAKPRYAQLDFPALVRLCDCFLEVDFTECLGEIQAPTCIIVGEDDLIKGRNYAEILQWGIPHAEMHVLPGSGHATCWERAEEFNTVVLGFLAKQEV